VVVVDDGSTDNSHEIITNYGDRIVPIRKENGGQASACNAGFRTSRGEIAIFLDADDVLLPDTVKRVVGVFRSRPRVVKVQYRMQIIDATGRSSGGFVPPAEIDMPSGDLRHRLIEANDYVWSPTSGNAFAAEVLGRIMPIPEAVYQGMPDVYLCNLSPVFGEVFSLETPGALYRIHGMNNYSESTNLLNLDLLRKQILAIDDSHMWQKYWFSTLYSAATRSIGPQDLFLVLSMMILLKLAPKNYPFKETLWKVFVKGCVLCAASSDPELLWSRRLRHIVWFSGMLLAPRFLAKSLAELLVGTEKEGWLYNKVKGVVWGVVRTMRRIG